MFTEEERQERKRGTSKGTIVATIREQLRDGGVGKKRCILSSTCLETGDRP
jgi:hypothetical protein